MAVIAWSPTPDKRVLLGRDPKLKSACNIQPSDFDTLKRVFDEESTLNARHRAAARMIVQCPNCDSRYRVNDANVPASGGKITCPSCKDKFIVYPEAPDAPQTERHSAFEDKTSVATSPDLKQLVSQMTPGGQAHDSGLNAQTEVMSPLSIPDSLKGSDPFDDGTVEMSSPDIADLRARDQAQGDDDSASTEILSSDALDHMGFHAPLPKNDSPHHGDTREHAPLRTELASSSKTDRLDFDPLANTASSATQERPSLPKPPASSPQTTPSAPPTSPKPPAQSAPSKPSPVKLPPVPASKPDPVEAQAPDASGPDANHEGPWKLKTNFGLTYEFSDNASLKNWLSSREELDGYELAGSADFYPVDAWPQFQRKPRVQQTIGMAAIPQQPPRPSPPSENQAPQAPQAPQGAPNFATPDRPASGPFGQVSATPHHGSPAPQAQSPGPTPSGNWDALNSAAPERKVIPPNNYQPPSRDSKVNWILWPIAALLFAIGVLLTVQVLGVYDVKSAILGEAPAPVAQEQPTPNTAAPPPQEEQAPAESDAPSAEAAELKKAVDRLLEDAELAIDNNRLQSASVLLNKAKLLDPERIAIYVLSVEVYTEMGRAEEAEAAQKTLDALRGTAAPSLDDEGTPTGESENEDSETL